MTVLNAARSHLATVGRIARRTLTFQAAPLSRDQCIHGSTEVAHRLLKSVWPEDFESIHDSMLSLDGLYSTLRRRLGRSEVWRFGPARQRMEMSLMLQLAAGRMEFTGARFFDIGCGKFHPFGLSTMAVGLGAESSVATDLVQVEDESRAAAALLELMAALVLNPGRMYGEIAPAAETVCVNLHQRLSVAALEEGHLYDALRGGMEHRVGSFFDLDFPADHFTIAHSHTVLEHIPDMGAFTRKLFATTAPGGMGYHLIDLRDHRIYDHAHHFQWWNFMRRAEYDDAGTRPRVLRLCNRLRAPEHVRLFEEAGFEVVAVKRQHEPIPAGAEAEFEPTYQELSEEDRTTSIFQLLTRRPV